MTFAVTTRLPIPEGCFRTNASAMGNGQSGMRPESARDSAPMAGPAQSSMATPGLRMHVPGPAWAGERVRGRSGWSAGMFEDGRAGAGRGPEPA